MVGPIPEEESDNEGGASSSGSGEDGHSQDGDATAGTGPSSSGQRLAQELGEADRELLESIRNRGEIVMFPPPQSSSAVVNALLL